MAIEFEQELGTGSATATSYASVAQYSQYWLNRGTTITDSSDSVKGYLNLATEFIDNNYNFKGDVAFETQALRWPRFNIYDKFGVLQQTNVIPTALINAVCYLGTQAKAGKLNIVDEGIKSQSFGPVSKTYSRSSSYRAFPYVDTLLKDYLVYGNKLQRVN